MATFAIKQVPKDVSYIPEHIKTSFEKWSKAEKLIPQFEYEKGYDSRNKTAFKLWKQFSELCKEAHIHPVKCAADLNSQKPF